jgi:hypothetical protein
MQSCLVRDADHTAPQTIADMLVPEHSHRWLHVQHIWDPEDQDYDPQTQTSSLRKDLRVSQRMAAYACSLGYAWDGPSSHRHARRLHSMERRYRMPGRFRRIHFCLTTSPVQGSSATLSTMATAVWWGLYRFMCHGVQQVRVAVASRFKIKGARKNL